MDDALLARDPADEQDVGRGRIDAMTRERVRGAGRPVLGGVDAIVNDMDPRRLDVEQAEHVLAGLPGDPTIASACSIAVRSIQVLRW